MDVNIGIEFLDLQHVFTTLAFKNTFISSSEGTIKTFKSSHHSVTDQLLDQVRRDFLENNIFETMEREDTRTRETGVNFQESVSDNSDN